MKGLPLPITGTGEETRDFTWVGDIVDGLLRAGVVEAAIGEEFNLASGRETTIKDLANKINAITGNEAGIKWAEVRKWDTKKRLRASVDKARNLIGYAPDTDFDWAMAQTVQWFKDNWELIDGSASLDPAYRVLSAT